MTDPAYAEWLTRANEWWRWHLQNPQVWTWFEQFAFEAVKRGRSRISHWLIINRIRWEVFITTTGVIAHTEDGREEFKISNDHIAFYARLWKHRYPQHASLFKTKRMVGEPGSPLIG